jgi:hypothetical protein|tara:strand:- start:430 stop:813 length:384 start_codon:yes stop_codon:yes gene_type:complete
MRHTQQTNPSDRFHYDHLNMFDKKDSMVNEGICIDEIYAEIDKCHILCLTCHHIVSDIENKVGFTRIKANLTRSVNHGDITEREYVEKTNQYQTLYEFKMKNIYEEIRKYYNKHRFANLSVKSFPRE